MGMSAINIGAPRYHAEAARDGRSAVGYYRMSRGWLDHELFEDEPFCKRAAWAWLVEHAAWRRTAVTVRGVAAILERGQLSYSLRFLAQAWGWSVARVRGFLAALAKRTMIRTERSTANDTGRLVLTLCNYEHYQASGHAEPHSDAHTGVDNASHKEESNQEDKKEGPSGPREGGDAALPVAKMAGSTSRAAGTNPRAVGTNPRAAGTNPRAAGTNPRIQTELLLPLSGGSHDYRPGAGRRRSPHQTLADASRFVAAARRRQMELSDGFGADSGAGAGLAAAGGG
jgi:hypothetical protein